MHKPSSGDGLRPASNVGIALHHWPQDCMLSWRFSARDTTKLCVGGFKCGSESRYIGITSVNDSIIPYCRQHHPSMRIERTAWTQSLKASLRSGYHGHWLPLSIRQYCSDRCLLFRFLSSHSRVHLPQPSKNTVPLDDYPPTDSLQA